ncbi:hypothetical protein DL546_009829 [Coniochaeta pulveracea]|uniref:Uncharacterized protein n=1 Tax=Coniochaeta pulveracea TaxID=177199 RepID=A0A420YP82_9PEZI|nr:hypothetical protein DL546_009829 [Coniochaeta pulveracea]
MKTALITTFLLVLGTSATPQPDSVSITEGENTYVGIDKRVAAAARRAIRRTRIARLGDASAQVTTAVGRAMEAALSVSPALDLANAGLE